MADIQLTPEMLLEQSTEMSTLQTEYESLFQQVKNSLNGVNQSWSTNIAANFSGKITSAQNSFSSILNMFSNGANAAKASALRFGTPSSWLEKVSNSLDDYWDNNIKNIADLSDDELKEVFPVSDYYDDGSDLGKGVDSINKVCDDLLPKWATKVVKGISESVYESFDPDREMHLGLQKEMDKFANGYVDASNNGDYFNMAYNGIMMTGLQTNYNIFNGVTNVAGDILSVPGSIFKAMDTAGEAMNVSEDNIGRVGARFTGNLFKIGSSVLKNFM